MLKLEVVHDLVGRHASNSGCEVRIQGRHLQAVHKPSGGLRVEIAKSLDKYGRAILRGPTDGPAGSVAEDSATQGLRRIALEYHLVGWNVTENLAARSVASK